MSLIAEEWVTKAMNLQDGEAIYIEVPNKHEQTVLKGELLKVKEGIKAIYPEEMSKIDITRKLKDRKFFVCISKEPTTLLEGFVRDNNGQVSVVVLDQDLGKIRRIKLMAMDGYKRATIEEYEGPLSDADCLKYGIMD
jgi:hypothetical protein